MIKFGRLTGLILAGLLLNFSAKSQKIKIEQQALLPEELNESSGLFIGENGHLWTINDSGNAPVLYRIDEQGNIKQCLRVSNAQNIDWEDLANDYKGYMYIADIGNNKNKRKELTIYKVKQTKTLQDSLISAEKITFYYENQKQFPPPKHRRIFDAESLIAYSDSLFIFTKNRSKPYNQYTYVYAIPNQKGHFKAELKDSILLKNTQKGISWITSAERYPNSNQVILLSHKKAWLLPHFRQYKHQSSLIPLKISGVFSQKEAIAIDPQNQIWITNEKYKCLRAKLKRGQLIGIKF